MELRVMIPSGVEVSEAVTKVTAEGQAGNFCLLERHVDYVAALEPGLLSFETSDGREVFLAVDGGVLVKVGPKVMVSTPRAVRGELGRLQQTVRDSFTKLSDRERQARAAVERMELDFVRQLIEWQHGR